MNEENNNTTNNENEVKPVEETVVENKEQAIAPTVDSNVNSPLNPTVEVEIDEKKTVEMENIPHDVPIPDENSEKKDFIIKSKKETVAEDVKLREAKIEEHVKKANENYKPNSKIKNFFLIFFLVFIILFTIFLPQIHEFVNKLKAGQLVEQKEVKITDGYLVCNYEKSSDTFTYEFEYDFTFHKNLLESYNKSTKTKGDTSLDMDELNDLYANCKEMKDESGSINGLDVKCDKDTGSVTVIEKFGLADFKTDSLTSRYTEAGGDYPEYSLEQDMDVVEKNMKAAGFTCERTKTIN